MGKIIDINRLAGAAHVRLTWIIQIYSKFSKFCKFIFENPEGQWPMWATYLHTRAKFDIWHWQR